MPLALILCRECGAEINRLRITLDRNRTVWCLACLANHPEATFGQRLRAHRFAASLSVADLEERSGVGRKSLILYELDRNKPTKWTLAKLIRALGGGICPDTRRGVPESPTCAPRG
jgi:hypothetical protein